MKVLVITPTYAPEITAYVPLITSLCEDLADYGHSVTVITPNASRGVEYSIEKEAIKKEELIKDGKLKIIRVPIIKQYSKKFIDRVISSLYFTFKSFAIGLKEKDVDVIFTCSTPPTLGITGTFLSFFKRKPLVYNLQDIFPDSMINTGMIKNKLIITIGKLVEKLTYSGSTIITVIGKDFSDNIINKNVKKEKISLIPNWVDEKETAYVEKENNIIFKNYDIDKSKFIVQYSGNMGYQQNLEMVLETAKGLKEYKDILFVMIGDGVNKEKLLEIKDKNKLENVMFIPFQDKKYISHVYSVGDVGLVTLMKNTSKNSIPSKTWSIMATERPVIASIDEESELVDLLHDENCGIGIQPDNSEELKKAILKVYSNRAECIQMGLNGRKYIENNLSRSANTKKYNDLFVSLTK